MARGHPGLPKPNKKIISKLGLLKQVRAIDSDADAKQRVLTMENDFRQRIKTHVNSLPPESSNFQKFSTNPFVLMIHCMKKGYTSIREIEEDILPAKLFSSMETSAGKMVELITLPVYGWDTDAVMSGMHSANSALDGRKIEGDLVRLATLKSGPRCLNDEMSENFADAIIANIEAWAGDANAKRVDFTYGVLYGTKKQSNKKDWHILRNLREKLPEGSVTVQPDQRWDCSFTLGELDVTVAVRIGADWWNHLAADESCFVELCVALIRACVLPSTDKSRPGEYTITDLHEIISIEGLPDDFNVAILQRSQIEWLFFLARHFADGLESLPPAGSKLWT